MTIYVVTGKLGSGKSLLAVDRIRAYLWQGRRVATNLDLRLDRLLPLSNRTAQVLRVPDKPTADDLAAIGKGCDSVDESRYGLLVLDELGVWLNSRTWADKDRQGVIDWLVHSRKYRWDVIFLIQHAESLDKQVRQALMEYHVKCKRLDRVKLPVISKLGELLSLGVWNGYLPRIHLGVVVYAEGGSAQSPLVTDRWFYRGHDLYQAYDTEQVFSSSYDHGLYSYLPPWQVAGRYAAPSGWERWKRELEVIFGLASPLKSKTAPASRLRPMMRLKPEVRWQAARRLVLSGRL